MQRLKVAALLVLIFCPLIALMANDAKYNRVITELCRSDAALVRACFDPEGPNNWATPITTAAFYRHLRTFMGGEKGTSWSFDDHLQALLMQDDPWAADAANDAFARLRQFNRHFVLSMVFSLVIASSAATLLVQHFVTRRHRS